MQQAITFGDHEVVEQPNNSISNEATFKCSSCGHAADDPTDLAKLTCE